LNQSMNIVDTRGPSYHQRDKYPQVSDNLSRRLSSEVNIYHF